MTLFDFRSSRGFRADHALSALGGDYLELDELLASGSEVVLVGDSDGTLLLGETDEFE